MPTYDYKCGSCGSAFEQFARFADYKPQVACECGATAERLFVPTRDVVVKGIAEYRFNPTKNVQVSKKWGRSARQEERNYEKVIETQRQLVKAKRAAGKERDGWEHLGTMPAPMVDSIGRHEGDKEAVLKDPIPFLKATGTYMGRD